MTTWRVNRTIEDIDEVNGNKYEIDSYSKVDEDGTLGQNTDYVNITISELKENKKNSTFEVKYNTKYKASIQIPKAALKYIIGEGY